MGDELRWFGNGEIESQHADVDGDCLNGVGSSDQDAGLIVEGFNDANGWIDPTENRRGGRVDGDSGVYVPASESCSAEHEGRIVTAWQPDRGESAAARDP